MDLHTHKKEFMNKNYFALGLVRVRLLFFVLIRVRQKFQLSYAIEKREREFLSYSFFSFVLLRIRKHSQNTSIGTRKK